MKKIQVVSNINTDKIDNNDQIQKNDLIIFPDELLVKIARFLDRQTQCSFALAGRRQANIIREVQKDAIRIAIVPNNNNPTYYWYNRNTLYAYGNNREGQLGAGKIEEYVDAFTQSKGLIGKILKVIPLPPSSLFVLTDMGLYVTGFNENGLCGLGDIDAVNTFTKIEGLPDKVLEITPGLDSTYEHTGCIFALTSEGLYVIGNNSNGQLGLGDIESVNTFTKIEGLPGKVLQVIPGPYNTFALTSEGLYGTGVNRDGQLGLGDIDAVNTFTKIEGLPGKILQIISTGPKTFVLTSEGLYGSEYNQIGYNAFGQLGLGDIDAVNTFTKIEGLPDKVLQVFPGPDSTFALTSEGLYGTGVNRDGQLGLGDIDAVNTFTKIEGLPGKILQIIPGPDNTFALTSEGLYGTGCNMHGQLGLGEIEAVKTFTQIQGYEGQISQILTSKYMNNVFVITSKGVYGAGLNCGGELGLGYLNSSVDTLTLIESIKGDILQAVINDEAMLVLTTEGLFCCKVYPIGNIPLAEKKNFYLDRPEQIFIKFEDNNLEGALKLYKGVDVPLQTDLRVKNKLTL